jgi:hypothetical protein
MIVIAYIGHQQQPHYKFQGEVMGHQHGKDGALAWVSDARPPLLQQEGREEEEQEERRQRRCDSQPEQ